MKKVLKIIGIVLLSILILVVLFLLTVFIYNQIISKETSYEKSIEK